MHDTAALLLSHAGCDDVKPMMHPSLLGRFVGSDRWFASLCRSIFQLRPGQLDALVSHASPMDFKTGSACTGTMLIRQGEGNRTQF